MAKVKHAHKYERVTLGKNYVVFRCILPNCPHYIRKELAEGKACLCNRCNGPMLLTKEAMQLKKPHCADCVVRKNQGTINAVKDVLADLFSSDDIDSPKENVSNLKERLKAI